MTLWIARVDVGDVDEDSEDVESLLDAVAVRRMMMGPEGASAVGER